MHAAVLTPRFCTSPFILHTIFLAAMCSSVANISKCKTIQNKWRSILEIHDMYQYHCQQNLLDRTPANHLFQSLGYISMHMCYQNNPKYIQQFLPKPQAMFNNTAKSEMHMTCFMFSDPSFGVARRVLVSRFYEVMNCHILLCRSIPFVALGPYQ